MDTKNEFAGYYGLFSIILNIFNLLVDYPIPRVVCNPDYSCIRWDINGCVIELTLFVTRNDSIMGLLEISRNTIVQKTFCSIVTEESDELFMLIKDQLEYFLTNESN